RRLLEKLRKDPNFPVNWLAWRQACSRLHYSHSITYEGQGDKIRAIGCLLTSMATYPFFYDQAVVQTTLERPKRLLILLLRLIRILPSNLMVEAVTKEQRSGEMAKIIRRSLAE